MADGNVRKAGSKSGTFLLPFDDVDRISDLSHQARAILGLIRGACTGDRGETLDDSIRGACWAVEQLVAEMEVVATKRKGASHG